MMINEYVLQGLPYIFDDNNYVRAQVVLYDEIDGIILQQALNCVLKKTDYFNKKLVVEDNEYILKDNEMNIQVFYGDEIREIPEETNGYMFYVSYEGNTIYITWNHFISDAKGMFPFVCSLVKYYCNYKYNESFAVEPLISSYPVFEEKVLPYYKNEKNSDIKISSLENVGRTRQTLISIEKEKIIENAIKKDVKPFSYIIYLYSKSMSKYAAKNQVSFSYPVDIRKDINADNAYYNCCVTLFEGIDDPLDDATLYRIDQLVRSGLTFEKKMAQMSKCIKLWSDLLKSNTTFAVKKRIHDMSKSAMMRCDFLLSYPGSPFFNEKKVFERFIKDYQLWAINSEYRILTEIISIHEKWNFCIVEEDKPLLFSNYLKTVFGEVGLL